MSFTSAHTHNGHPAHQLLEEWLTIIISGDVDSLGQFIDKSYSETALRWMSGKLRTAYESDMMRSRPWTLHSFEARSETEGSMLIYSEMIETWVQVNARVSAETPYKLEWMSWHAAKAPNDAPAGHTVTDEDLPAYLDAYLAKLSDAGLFSGTILVANGDQVLYENAFGLANRETNTPNQRDTKLNLGSMNKMVTAVAIAQLVERGLVNFDALISEYLPDLPIEIATQVTVAHLLTHTSGITGFFQSPHWAAYRDNPDTVRGYFPLFIDEPLRFEPGVRHEYSNSNFTLLGAIIEAVTGQNYFDYVRQNIYIPAGMTATAEYMRNEEVPNLAIGYTRSAEMGKPSLAEEHPNTALLPMRGSPAGGGYSTVNDLYRFAQALRNGTLVSAAMVETLTEGKVNVGISPTPRYAYGFGEDRINGSRVVGHSGGFPGVNSNLDIYMDTGYIVVVLSNIDMGGSTVNNRLRQLLTTAQYRSLTG